MKYKQYISVICISLAIVLLVSSIAVTQADAWTAKGVLFIKVKLPDGSPAADAVVRVLDSTNSVVATGETGQWGLFLTRVPRGMYRVVVSMDGFHTESTMFQIRYFKKLFLTLQPLRWTSDGSVLWGGSGDLIDSWGIFAVTLPTGSGLLTFDTSYDIEDFWDFGFVQISTDSGYTWTSLANALTTSTHDPNTLPGIINNLPGITGSSGGWIFATSFDLSAYSGSMVHIAFRYLTDWTTTLGGWYIDNVYVYGTLISDGTDASVFQTLSEVLPTS
jgi:hypothetical protein